jgi:hypothetical protein
MQTFRFDGRRAEEGRHESVGREKRSRALTDSRDDVVLVRERVTTGLEDDLLKRWHRPSVSRRSDNAMSEPADDGRDGGRRRRGGDGAWQHP